MRIMKCRKQIRKLVSFLAIVCCLAGSALPAMPAEAAGTGDGTVVFTNEPKNSPDLYVTKTVENADPERAGDLFQFVLLKPNGQKADPMSDRVYRVYQLDGSGGVREVLRKDRLGNVMPFQTDKSGVFTLEAGQRACFENLGAGIRYEVQELNAYLSPRDVNGTLQEVSSTSSGYYNLYYRCAKDDTGAVNKDGEVLHTAYTYRPVSLDQGNYSIVQPAGGTTGASTLPENGGMVDFVNSYAGGSGGGTASLTVSKAAVWPADWTAPVTDEFWFRVEINRGYGLEAYGGREYTLTDPAVSGASTLRTAADGTFPLKAGCTAVFTEIPAGADYRVCEIVQGTRKDPTDATGQKTIAVSLPEGWEAVGTVTEEKGEKIVVREGALETANMPANFLNSNLSFVVTKKLNDNGKPDVDFNFRLTDAGNNGRVGVPYYLYKTTGKPVYYEELTEAEREDGSGNSIGPEVQEDPSEGVVDSEGVWHRRHLTVRETGTDGAFTLKAGQAAVFTGVGMPKGTSYRVVESGTPSYVQMLPLPEDDGKVYSVNPNTVQTLDFTNKKMEPAGNLTVLKQVQNAEGEGSLDSGKEFHFILYQRVKTAEDFRKLGVMQSAPGTETDADDAVKSGLADGTLLRSSDEVPAGGETPAADAWKTDYRYTDTDHKEYAVYAPVSKAYYTLPDGILSGGQSEPNGETGPKGDLKAGEFTLQAGKTVNFTRLSADCEYVVREIGLTSEYTEDTDSSFYKTFTMKADGKETPVSGQSAELTSDGLSFTFVNTFTPEKADLTITKTDADGQVLPGAEFMLYLAQGRDQENKVLPADLQGMTPETFCWKTGEEGEVTITDLKLGTYWLYETKAPSKYILLRDPIEIQVARTAEDALQVTVNGRTAENARGGPVGSAAVTDGKPNNTNSQISITVINSEYYKLPSTGGMGIYWYLISGMLLMMAAALISYKYQRRGRC